MNSKALLKFLKKYKLNVKLIDASKLFIKKLKGVTILKKRGKLLEIYLLRFSKERQKKYNDIKYLAPGRFIQTLLKAGLLLAVKRQK